MNNRVLPGKLALAGIGGCLLLAIVGPSLGGAQSSDSAADREKAAGGKMSFEVASIKPDPDSSHYIGTNIDMEQVGNRYVATGVTARDLIGYAYGVKKFQTEGGPSWIDSAKYAIDAKIDDQSFAIWQGQSHDEQEKTLEWMFQSLLADRFRLQAHHATRELPVYALVVAKNGAKLISSAQENSPIGNANQAAPTRPGSSIHGQNRVMTAVETDMPMSAFANVLSGLLEGRRVIDQTGLAGNYTFTMRWTDGDEASDAVPADPSAPSIWTAVQEQLGLKLESTKGPVDTIVIDHIEEPSPN